MRFLFFFVSLFFSAAAFGQRGMVDSLLSEAGRPRADTAQIKLLSELSYAFSRIDPDSGLLFGRQALRLSENVEPFEALAEMHNSIGVNHWSRGEYDSALLSFIDAAEADRQIGAYDRLSGRYTNIGAVYEMRGEYEEAFAYYRKSIDIDERNGNESSLGTGYARIAGLYEERGEHAEALQYYQRALPLVEKSGDARALANLQNNVGLVYAGQGEYEEAIGYYERALATFEELGALQNAASALTNIANAYSNQELHAQALPYFRRSNALEDRGGTPRTRCISYHNLGTLFLKLEAYDSAKVYHDKALSLSREIGLKHAEAFTLAGLAEIALEQKQPSQALVYAEQALEMAEAMGHQRLTKNAFSALHLIYAELGRYRDAYEAHRRYKQAADTLFNAEKTKELTRLESEYEFGKERAEMQAKQQVLEREKALQSAELRERNLYLVGAGGGLATVLLVSLLLYRQREAKAAANAELAQKNEEILQQSEELAAQRDQLIELDGFKQGMTGMIVHDLKNPLNSVISVSSEKPDRDWRRVKQAGRQMLNLVSNILDVQKFEQAEVALDLADASVRDVAQEAIDQVDLLAAQKPLELRNAIPTDLGARLDRELTVRVFVNLLTNAIKYTPPHGLVILSGEVAEGTARLSVVDTGIGIPQDKLASVFDKFGQVQAKASGAARSTGLGLTFCKLVVEESGGQIGVESEEGQGATFWFTLPLAGQAVRSLSGERRPQEIDAAASLTEEERATISPIIAAMRRLEVYDVSEVQDLLDRVPETGKGVGYWKEAVGLAVYHCDEERFAGLLNAV